MSDGLGRRDFVRASALGVVTGITGCQTQQSTPETGTESVTDRSHPTTESGATTEPRATDDAPVLSGTAVALSGEPIAGATVEALVPGEGTVAETTTDGSGRFGLETAGRPAWVQIQSDGFHARTVAVGPGAGPTVELTPSDGTVSLSFCGDVMFGRRFYGTSDEPGPRVRITPSTRLADHRAILEGVAPLLASADITSVNLETPLTTTGWRHPEKVFTFVSHPVAARALADAGVDYCSLGNNHAFDALVPGLADTIDTLDSVGIAHSGAGRSSEAAWRPALVERRGRTVGFLSCTTVVEPQHDIDLSADRGDARTHTVTRETDDGRESITFPGDVGAAEPTEQRLGRRVAETADRADVTVVQIHGGYDYQRQSIAKVRGLADAAIGAGAALVVCHHPHVTGGLEIRNGALVAWSLGNFVFDQTRWATFPSYVLTAHVGPSGVERAFLEPVVLDGYVPTGVVGKPRTDQLWRTAGLSSGEFDLGQLTLQYVRDRTPAREPSVRTFEGTAIHARREGWPRSVLEGGDAVQFGRDRLPTGRFDGPAVDTRATGEPLWRVELGSTEATAAVDYGDDGTVDYGDDGTVRLVRDATADEAVGLGPVARIPVSGPLTVAGRYSFGGNTGVELRVSWYERGRDSPVDQERFALRGTTDGWTWVREDVVPPEGATHVNVTVQLSPPTSGKRMVALDDLRVVEWVPAATGGREYDHLRVDGATTVEFVAPADHEASGEIRWPELAD